MVRYRSHLNGYRYQYPTVDLNVGHLEDTTGAGGGIFFSVVFFCLKNQSPVTSVVLDLAATLFTPETPNLFCELKHFTHPYIGIVVSR